MDRIRPKIQNKTEIPVNIFKGEELIATCPNIQEAARFFKKETNAQKFNWKAIHSGIWFGESTSINGATYYFTTDPLAVQIKMEKKK
jgi:hypothetical protein